MSRLLTLFIITHLVLFCQEGFWSFFSTCAPSLNCGTLPTISPAHGVSPLLTLCIIPQWCIDCNSQNAQNFRILSDEICAKKILDKNCAGWYNNKFRAFRTLAPGASWRTLILLSMGKLNEKRRGYPSLFYFFIPAFADLISLSRSSSVIGSRAKQWFPSQYAQSEQATPKHW